MKELGRSARGDMTVYLAGGSSAVLRGWRANTVDVDMKMVPDRDEVYRALPALKESLELNIELACPDDFIPELPGWQERSAPIAREGTDFVLSLRLLRPGAVEARAGPYAGPCRRSEHGRRQVGRARAVARLLQPD